MNWAKSDNTLIKDLKDFTATFFQKNTLLNVLLHYSVFDARLSHKKLTCLSVEIKVSGESINLSIQA